ncbi:DUF3999 family protein [Novosphingobium sp.]|uniref:DUF3999 family protein n=1 Tax=Novosphingobium sp. TaxID=1874826 RepID=UPI0035B35A36
MILRSCRLAAIAALALLSSCNEAAKAPAPTSPDAFKVRLAVEPAPGGSVQRVLLPAQALIAIQRTDLGDVRIFDGRGKPLTLALDGLGTLGGETQHSLDLPAIPVMGNAETASSGVSISVDNQSVGHVVISGADAGEPAGEEVVAALFDTRKTTEPAVALTLDADLPLQRPVNVTVEASTDLASWQPLGEKVMLRTAPTGGAGGDLLGSARIQLGGADLRQRYLRVTWGGAAGVNIKGATLTTAQTAPLPRVTVQSSGVKLEEARRMRFSVGFATPLAALRLTESGPDGVVPVKLYGRNAPEEQWSLIAAGIVRQGEKGSLIDTDGATFRNYRIEADQRSAGFAAAPKLELLFDPVELVAAFNGAAPYVLAVGSAAAAPAYFAPGEVVPAEVIKAGPLPIAKVDISGTPPLAIAVTPQGEGPFDLRKAALWAVLLLGTAILAFAAIRLMRSNQPGS